MAKIAILTFANDKSHLMSLVVLAKINVPFSFENFCRWTARTQQDRPYSLIFKSHYNSFGKSKLDINSH